MRPLRLLTAAVLVAAPLSVVATGPAAATTTGPVSGTYVALPVATRIVDTRSGVDGNPKGAVAAGHGITINVGGLGGVPHSGLDAVAGTLTATSGTANGGVIGYIGTRPTATNLQFLKGQTISDAVILPVAEARLTLYNTAASGSVQLVFDVSGYYVSGTASSTDPGIYHPVHPSRVVDTRSGADGNHKGAVNPGSGIEPALGGHGGVPTTAGEVAVTISVVSPTRSGSILGYRPGEPEQSLPLLHFTAGHSTSAFAVLRLSGSRTILLNTSAGTVQIIVDVSGYYNIGFTQTANTFQSVVQTRIQRSTVAANADLAVPAGGKGGVPLTGVAAVLATVHAVSPTKSGAFQAWKAGAARPSSTTVLQFAAAETTSNTILVAVSSNGTFELHNSSSGTTGIDVDIDGYVPASAVTPPALHGIGHYVRSLTTSPSSESNLNSAAKADADAHDTFVLLDLGAESNDRKGVVQTGTTTVIPWYVVIGAINEYVSTFVGNGGPTATIAIGTNNDGNWSTVSAYGRAADWWNDLMHSKSYPLTKQNSITFAAADDIEAGFASTESQALTFETQYLGYDTTPNNFYFNGSADGCPVTWTSGGTCNYGWTESQLSALATANNNPRAYALPQIYVGAQATQWAEIDKTGGGKIKFFGALTTHATDSSTLTPQQGWTALARSLSSVTTTSPQTNVVDIKVN